MQMEEEDEEYVNIELAIRKCEQLYWDSIKKLQRLCTSHYDLYPRVEYEETNESSTPINMFVAIEDSTYRQRRWPMCYVYIDTMEKQDALNAMFRASKANTRLKHYKWLGWMGF